MAAVSAHGARIVLSRSRIYPGDTLRIINLENYAEADFEVIGPMAMPTDEQSEWGVVCLEAGRNIWDIAISAPLAADSSAETPLECRACGRQEIWPLSRMQIEVLDSTATIACDCTACAQLTYWTYADVSRRTREFGPADPVAPPPRATKKKEIPNRRRQKRIAIRMPVRVEDAYGNAEISQTENVTTGGLAVLLGMELAVGDLVTVCCPYMNDGQNIPQRAEVRWTDTYAAGKRFLYGFRYMKE
jgi:hypothetical protein